METALTPTASTPTDAASFDAAFRALLHSWNRHHSLKDEHAPLDELWSSRCVLMDRRELVATARAAA